MKLVLAFLLSLFMSSFSFGQIIEGQDTLYGNEWINFDQQYYKILVAEDGIYKVSGQDLMDAGVPISTVIGSTFQVFHNGKEIPLYVSTDQPFQHTDYLLFYGEKNRSELDRYLFKNPDEEMMNSRYSLITDSAAYFLTWSAVSNPARFETVQNDLSNLPPKEAYYLSELELNLNNAWAKEQNSQGISLSNFTLSEGFSSSFQNVQSYSLTPSQPYAAGPKSQLSIRYSGNLNQHQQLITINGQSLTTDEFYGYEVRQLNLELDNSLLSGALEVKFQGLTDNNDKQRVSDITLTYPRMFDFSNSSSFAFRIPASTSDKYLEIQNFNYSISPEIFDLTNSLRISAVSNNGLVKIKLPSSSNERKLILVNMTDGIRKVASISPVSFINYVNIEADFVILSNPKLFDDGNGNNWVQAYADYRSSSTGGGYQTIIVDVQQLYEQFAWGLNRHPLSIRNFALYIKKKWSDPKYFFIIGKGREYPGVRTAGQLASSANASFFVPTYGIPGSDNQLLAGSDGFTPIIPVGRIAASLPNDVRVYLDKVKEFEANRGLPQTIDDRAWMKRVLHMGGGGTASEQSIIKSYLGSLENKIESSKMGGDVTSFFKTSTDPIQIPQTEQLFNVINNGVSILTFFGHSGVGTFDFNIDNPDNYQNIPRFPLMISLGCFAGNIHTSTVGVSERFVLFDKGAIAFAATSGQGYISSLYVISSEFYNLIGNEMYGRALGDILRQTIQNVNSGGFGENLIRQQLNFHGDPSIHLITAPSPDFVIDASSVEFSPTRPNISLDSFDIRFKTVNIGSYAFDSILVQVTQEFPSGIQKTVVDAWVPSPGFEEELTFIIPTGGKEAVGQNRYFIKVDASDRVQELPDPAAEANNELISSDGTVGIVLYITDNSAVAVYPAEFAIVSSPEVILKASTTNPLLPSRKYLFEIDTTETFDSPLLLHTGHIQAGGVLRWQPPMNWQDSTVYYWRVSPDSISPQQGFSWSTSSFTYIPGNPPGWSQSHFYQFKKDEFVNMELQEPGNLKYITNYKDFNISNAVNTVAGVDLRVNNAYYGRYWGLPDAGVYVLWMDSVFVEPKVNFPPGDGPYQYGIPHPNGWWVRTFMFDASVQEGRKELMEFLDDVIADHEYVAFFTVQKNISSDFKPEDWAADSVSYGKNLFQILESQGSAKIRLLNDLGSRPYIFVYQKGVGVIGEELADSLTDVLNLYFSLPGYWDRGFIQTPLVGPSKKWISLNWQVHAASHPETDSVRLQLYGVRPNGVTETLLMDSLSLGESDISFIDAKEFPYLKIRFNSKDEVYRSSPHLDSWQVIYEGVPEFAVNPASHYFFHGDTLQQGESLKLDFEVENLSNFDSDSLLIKFTTHDRFNQDSGTYQRVKPLLANDSMVAHLTLDSKSLSKDYTLSVEINPGKDQPEQSTVNNFLITEFYVESDSRTPLLDVTFDGIHILDGDLISPSPEIVITLKDENEYLKLTDTSLIKVFILYPDSSHMPVYVPFENPTLTFIPAYGVENKATIFYTPTFTIDGEYELVVQARDATGNASGAHDFKQSFRVVTKSMISNIVNYPNPFTTSTRFLYTLTGAQPPAHYKIQIMTISGRIVREVTQTELGPLIPGTHLTDFVWDGTDEFGDCLANGVYLYRFIAKYEDGKEWETFETGADAFVKDGVGKMVLLR